MSSPFDNIDIPSDEPIQKPKYVRERQRIIREMILLSLGITILSSLAVTIYDAFLFEGDLDCLLRPIGGFIGGFIGSCFGAVFLFVQETYESIKKEVKGAKQQPVEEAARFGFIVGSLFGSAYGAAISTSQADGRGLDFIYTGVGGGVIAIVIYAIYKYRKWKHR